MFRDNFIDVKSLRLLQIKSSALSTDNYKYYLFLPGLVREASVANKVYEFLMVYQTVSYPLETGQKE